MAVGLLMVTGRASAMGQVVRAAAAPVPDAGAPVWQGEAHGVVLRASAGDVTLARAGGTAPFFSYRAFHEEAFRRELTEARGDGPASDVAGCTRKVVASPVAWTGSSLTFRETVETSCPREAHPAGESRFRTFVIAEATTTARPMSAKDATAWFDERAFFAALGKDALVKRAMAGVSPPPRTLDALVSALAETAPVVEGEGKACYAFPDDLPTRVVPDHLEKDKLAVRVALPGTAVCRDHLTELGLLVPMARAASVGLRDAGAGKAGFLRRNVPPAIKARPVEFELRP
ncbi:MAG TPA: hypothetical protein VHU40_12005 [Polyangia bacterium]|nr:hypothetical protein [Polyangia bacterium]